MEHLDRCLVGVCRKLVRYHRVDVWLALKVSVLDNCRRRTYVRIDIGMMALHHQQGLSNMSNISNRCDDSRLRLITELCLSSVMASACDKRLKYRHQEEIDDSSGTCFAFA